MATKAQLQAEVGRLIEENEKMMVRFSQMKTRAVHVFLETHEGYLYLKHDLDRQLTHVTGIPRVAMEWIFETLDGEHGGLLTAIGKESKAFIDKLDGE